MPVRFLPLLAVFLFLQAPGLLLADDERPDWHAALELETVRFDNVTIYYQPLFEPVLDDVRRVLQEKRATANDHHTTREVIRQVEPIVDRMNELIGFESDEEQRAEQVEKLTEWLEGYLKFQEMLVEGLELCLVDREAAKDYLRQGRSLPNTTYDPDTDEASSTWAFRYVSGRVELGGEEQVVVLPVGEIGEAVDDVDRTLGLLGRAGDLASGGRAIGSMAEQIIDAHLPEGDRYGRWFAVGYGDAVAYHLLLEFAGHDAAETFRQTFQDEEHDRLQEELNLLFWLKHAYSIGTPLQHERALRDARRAHAVRQAHAFIRQHGFEHLSIIVPRMLDQPDATEGLAAAYRDVLNEDLTRLLGEYQPFATREEGVARYSRAFDDAQEAGDREAALIAILRLHELRQGVNLRDYSVIAGLLHELGHAEAAVKVFTDKIETFERHGHRTIAAELRRRLVGHAVDYDNPEPAYETAEQVLAATPDFVPALLVRAHGEAASGEWGAARRTLERVLELDPDPEGRGHRIARNLLAALDERER